MGASATTAVQAAYVTPRVDVLGSSELSTSTEQYLNWYAPTKSINFALAKTASTTITIIEEAVSATTSTTTIKRKINEFFADTPILAKVAWCESRQRQYDKQGNVLRGEENSDDIGVMQINEMYHAKDAKEKGMDIYSFEGNLKFAKYLYEKKGTSPWSASRPCWGKDIDLAINK